MEKAEENNKQDTSIGFLSRTFFLILGITLLGMMGGALLGPVLPALIEPFGVTEDRVGQVLAVYTFFTAVTMPFLGPLIDKLGRKQVVVPCLLLNGFAGLLAAFAPSFTVLLVIRALQGMGIAGLLPVAMTLIRDFFEGPKRVKAMGYLTSVLAIGGTIAPIIGGNLAVLSWRFAFLFYTVSIPLAVAIYFWMPATGGNKDVSLWGFVSNYGVIIKNKSFLLLAATNFMVAFSLYAIITFIPLLLVLDVGVSEGIAGMVVAIQALAVALVSIMIRKVAERFNTVRLISFGFILIAASFAALPFMDTVPGVGISLLVFGIGMGCVFPLLNTMITHAVQPRYVGAATSLYNSLNFVGQSTSPLVLGVVSGWLGLGAVFGTAGVLAVVAGLGVLLVGRHYPAAIQ